MDSFLVVGGTMVQRKEKALYFAKTYNVSKFDINIIEKDLDESIGINEIREIKKSLAFKPFNSRFKVAVILDFEKATRQAQNAFLKTLEEPPRNTIIVLTAPNTELLLPTIVSRCQVIQLLTTRNSQLTNDQLEVSSKKLFVTLRAGVGDKLKLAQERGKTREDTLTFLEETIINTRQQLIDDILKNNNHSISKSLSLLISFQKTHTKLSSTNINPRLALENLFLNLP